MDTLLNSIRERLRSLPAPVLHLDLLVFRRAELLAPSDWPVLADHALALLSAVETLRGATLTRIEGSRPAAARLDDPPFRDLAVESILDLGEAELAAGLTWAHGRRSGRGLHGPRPASRAEQPPVGPLELPESSAAAVQLAALLEERLLDVLLETQAALRRLRRIPQIPPEDNRLLAALPIARRHLTKEVANALESTARRLRSPEWWNGLTATR